MDTETGAVNQDIPEIKVPAAIDANGMIRFEVSDEQMEHIYTQLDGAYTESEKSEIVPIEFAMKRETFEMMGEGVSELEDGLPRTGMKVIPLTGNPSFAVTVLLSSEQITNTLRTTNEALSDTAGGDTDAYAQAFQLSHKAAIVVLRQMEAALNGAANPVGAIDIEAIRSNYT